MRTTNSWVEIFNYLLLVAEVGDAEDYQNVRFDYRIADAERPQHYPNEDDAIERLAKLVEHSIAHKVEQKIEISAEIYGKWVPLALVIHQKAGSNAAGICYERTSVISRIDALTINK